MTKLMTYAVLDDEIRAGRLSLETPVTVTNEDARVAAYKKSTEVWLRQGEEFSVQELIYAMMIQSANDAAYTLAHKAGGTVAAFVAQMNAKARELGMNHSTFRTPHGYPPPSHRIADGDLTTPRDYSLLCRYLLPYRHPQVHLGEEPHLRHRPARGADDEPQPPPGQDPGG